MKVANNEAVKESTDKSISQSVLTCGFIGLAIIMAMCCVYCMCKNTKVHATNELEIQEINDIEAKKNTDEFAGNE